MWSLVGRFELEVIGGKENFAVFAEILYPIAPESDGEKKRILNAARGELIKLAGDAPATFEPGSLAILDSGNATWPTPIEDPHDPRLLI